MEKKCIYEKVVTTSKESYSRIYLESIEFAKTVFKVGQKFIYELDFENKQVKILPSEEDKMGSMTKRKKKEVVPVLNIQNKNIGKVFEGIRKCKIKIYEEEIIVEPLYEENEKEEYSSKIEEYDKNNTIDYKDYLKRNILSAKEFGSQIVRPLYRIKKNDLYDIFVNKGLDTGDLDNIFEFSKDPITEKFKKAKEVVKDIPVIMKTIKLLSLFTGIGAFEKALDNNDIPYEVVNYCEIDEHASKAYSAIHNVSERLNLWDITKVDPNKLPEDIDIITHGSPCQDFSSCGLQKGGDEFSGTRSSLMWNTIEIVKKRLPKFVIWENVKNALSKRHKYNVDKYMQILKEMGYKSYCDVLDSKEHGVPHSRSRVFIVSILGEHKPFKFPSKVPLSMTLQEFLTDNGKPGVAEDLKPGCRKEFLKHYDNIIRSTSGIYDCKAKTDFQDKKVGIKWCPCLRSGSRNAHVLDKNKCVRRITMKEAWRLMGFGEKAYEKVKAIGMSLTQMQKQIGNSIDVNVVSKIFKNLLCC